MNTKALALNALMEEHGFSTGLITATLHAIGWSGDAMDDLIVYIEDQQPDEDEFIAQLSKFLL